ncbi:MAG: 1-acyl-sn-glycerol-3-phosphate acyltransferase [Candidatus Omnitrophota bacterium]|nr:MAG: 1-acyl-sn-glycerol-3-phosphate acyltransferase [Candidatus Omnitrophota bacterium]
MSSIVISIAIWTAGFALTILLFFVELFLTVVLFPFDKEKRILHAQCFWWANAVIGLNPYWNLRVSGLENIDAHQAYVITANHQSMGDIIVMYKIHTQFRWVAKESLFKIPFIGWCLSLTKHVKLTRGQFGSIKKVYREAGEWLRKDISVLFFPEGTRSDTDEINEFRNGAFKLAIKEKKPILPISITGTREAIPKGSWIFKTRVFAKLKVLPPIDTGKFQPGDFARLRDIVHAKLESAAH